MRPSSGGARPISRQTRLLARWHALKREVEAQGARLVAVSKYAPESAVDSLAAAGQRDFGESRPQALRDRARRRPDLVWHMIGPLQKNKAKYVGRYAAYWHSVEDAATAREVARFVRNRPLKVLLQVKFDPEPGRHGVEPAGLPALYDEVRAIECLEVVGLMTMASKDGDARAAFRALRRLRDALGKGHLPELSMGMSGDFRMALNEGATMVRLGSILFAKEETA